MKHKLAAIALTLFTVIIAGSIVGAYYLEMLPIKPAPYFEERETNFDYTSGVEVTRITVLNTVYNDITKDYRPAYAGMTDQQYLDFFGELPSFPEDFFDVAQLVYDGKITDYSRISSTYWLQPEFYPGWFACVNASYINNDPLRWTPQGYGCYPAIKEVEIPAGSDVIVNTYFKTGYGIESYQGLVVRAILPTVAKDLRGNELFTQPQNAANYFTCNIKNPDDSTYNQFKDTLMVNNVGANDWITILKPSYQLLKDKYGNPTGESGFQEDWVRLLELGIKIADNTPKGDYVVALDIDTPCFEINQEYYLSETHTYYGAMYYPAGTYFRTSIPHFQCIVHVV
jgi:hypothetical protein